MEAATRTDLGPAAQAVEHTLEDIANEAQAEADAATTTTTMATTPSRASP